jgi:hypothetical protein
MLEMRGEMMKAMGEFMVKHGKMICGGATNEDRDGPCDVLRARGILDQCAVLSL